ncbi:MAG TPA: CapA family protein [Micromonosporaceae bacterium]|nr:CapA family protein [Micromonosporaceae bacterium]
MSVTVFLCGDVMTGRGVDQILPHPGDPRLWEGYVRDARGYVKLAEAANGPIPAPVPVTWPWGDALAVLDQERPDARIINLETSITSGGEPAPGKGIHYRMSPANIGCIAAARPDVCALANNHVLDFGYQGLAETLDTLAAARISMAGAGRDAADANRPATVAIPERGRLVVRSVGTRSSGIPHSWAATGTRPGVALLADRPDRAAYAFGEELASAKEPGDIVVVSIHWGPNWGYSVSTGHVELAHLLIDSGADVVHGHSSHHARPIEVYRDRLILYGCGDFINDYEGIAGNEEYRPDLRVMYLATLEAGTGRLLRLRMLPMRAERMRLRRATTADVEHLCDILVQISDDFGTRCAQVDGMVELVR